MSQIQSSVKGSDLVVVPLLPKYKDRLQWACDHKPGLPRPADFDLKLIAQRRVSAHLSYCLSAAGTHHPADGWHISYVLQVVQCPVSGGGTGPARLGKHTAHSGERRSQRDCCEGSWCSDREPLQVVQHLQDKV